MKPRPEDELRRLRTNIDKLTALIRHATEENEQAQLEREKLLQEQWRLQRETATHKRSAEDYDALLEENERLSQSTREVKTALHQILDWSKSAGAELRR
jgi:uncharacterized protein YaiL (DUF2058 family)